MSLCLEVLEVGLRALLALGAFTPVMSALEWYCAVALRFMVSPHRLRRVLWWRLAGLPNARGK